MKKTKKKINHNEKNAELFKLYTETKDETEIRRIRNEIMVVNMSLVNFVVNKYYASKTPDSLKPELVQEGYLGLVSAISNYDYTLGFKFSAYAVWWIKQRINNYIINNAQMIKVPAHIKLAQNKLLSKMNEEGVDNVRDLTSLNPADYDITKKMLRSIKSSLVSRNLVSTSTPISSPDGSGSATVEDMISDNKSLFENIESPRDISAMVNAMAESLLKMEDKMRTILLLRFGIINSVGEVKKSMGVLTPRKVVGSRKKSFGIKKAKRKTKKYVSLKDGAVDFRKMAKIMSEAGFKMNHATARNQVIKAIEDLVRFTGSTLGSNLGKAQIKQISNDQDFQNNLQDVLHPAYEKYLVLKKEEQKNANTTNES